MCLIVDHYNTYDNKRIISKWAPDDLIEVGKLIKICATDTYLTPFINYNLSRIIVTNIITPYFPMNVRVGKLVPDKPIEYDKHTSLIESGVIHCYSNLEHIVKYREFGNTRAVRATVEPKDYIASSNNGLGEVHAVKALTISLEDLIVTLKRWEKHKKWLYNCKTIKFDYSNLNIKGLK